MRCGELLNNRSAGLEEAQHYTSQRKGPVSTPTVAAILNPFLQGYEPPVRTVAVPQHAGKKRTAQARSTRPRSTPRGFRRRRRLLERVEYLLLLRAAGQDTVDDIDYAVHRHHHRASLTMHSSQETFELATQIRRLLPSSVLAEKKTLTTSSGRLTLPGTTGQGHRHRGLAFLRSGADHVFFSRPSLEGQRP